ncbi:tail fiber protein [Weissella phage PWc]|nr:tail fiber protein [Weissella phage PWc]
MADYSIKTEVHKREREVTIYMTQGEATNIPYEIYLFNDQKALDLTGATVEYRATLPNNKFVNQLIPAAQLDAKKGLIKWLPDKNMTQADGIVDISHFVITFKDGRNIKTRDIVIDISPAPDLSGEEAKTVITQIDDMKNRIVEIGVQADKVEKQVTDIQNEIKNNPEKFRGLKGDKGDQGIQGVKGDKGDAGGSDKISMINYNNSFPPVDYSNADVLNALAPSETKYYAQTANNNPVNVPWSGTSASLAVRMRNNGNAGKEIVYTFTGQTWERVTTNLGATPAIGKWIRTDAGAISEYLQPVSGTFDAEDVLAGSKFEYTVSGNQVTINYAYSLNNVDVPAGDVIVGTLPAGVGTPFSGTARGFIMNVSSGANFGSLRIGASGKVNMNWNSGWKAGSSSYVEGSISYISNTLLPNQLA